MDQEQRNGFSRRLRQLIQVKGLQNKDVAEIMGVSGEMVRRYTAEPCLGLPSHGRVKAFAESMGVSPQWLAYGEGDMIQDERATAQKVPVFSPSAWPASTEPKMHTLTNGTANLAFELEDDAMKVQGLGTAPMCARGSVVLVDESATPTPGDLVAATNGERTVIRVFAPQDAAGTDFSLLSASPMFPPIKVSDGFRVIGRVVEVRSPQ